MTKVWCVSTRASSLIWPQLALTHQTRYGWVAKESAVRVFASLLTILTVSGCITNDYSARHTGAGIPTETEACAIALATSEAGKGQKLDSSNIRLVNWNIQKGGNPAWATDLASLTIHNDLMVFQEAALELDAWALVGDEVHRSFAPGYRTSRSITGVMTLSSAEPLAQCNLSSVEPWLGSPKATMITEYGLTDTEQTLLVVNIHAINFTLGTVEFKQQFAQALDSVVEHDGPILLSGDFNTWHTGRSNSLEPMLDAFGFSALSYDEDHRKRAFGLALDHIYVRGLRVIDATTGAVSSSDHNPMFVRLRLDDSMTGGI